jgi:two-component system OmpR family response regulator
MARILLIDDDEAFLEIIGDHLKTRGHEVASSIDPREAAALAEAHVPDLMILDFAMPQMTGPEVLARLREQGRFRELPAVFLSGIEALHVSAQVPPDRHVRFLRKPVDLRELEGAISTLLDPDSWHNAP